MNDKKKLDQTTKEVNEKIKMIAKQNTIIQQQEQQIRDLNQKYQQQNQQIVELNTKSNIQNQQYEEIKKEYMIEDLVCITLDKIDTNLEECYK